MANRPLTAFMLTVLFLLPAIAGCHDMGRGSLFRFWQAVPAGAELPRQSTGMDHVESGKEGFHRWYRTATEWPLGFKSEDAHLLCDETDKVLAKLYTLEVREYNASFLLDRELYVWEVRAAAKLELPQDNSEGNEWGHPEWSQYLRGEGISDRGTVGSTLTLEQRMLESSRRVAARDEQADRPTAAPEITAALHFAEAACRCIDSARCVTDDRSREVPDLLAGARRRTGMMRADSVPRGQPILDRFVERRVWPTVFVCHHQRVWLNASGGVVIQNERTTAFSTLLFVPTVWLQTAVGTPLH